MVQATLAHVAAGCNAATNALSVAVSSVSSPSVCGNYCAAFASKNVVCLLKSNVENGNHSAPLKVVETLKHREATTDATKFTSIRLQSGDQSGDVRVVVGDSEGRVFVWTREIDDHWKLQKPQGAEQTLPVAAVAIAETKRRRIYVAAFADGSLAVFEEKEKEDVTLLSRLELGRKSIMETLDVTVVGDQVVLAAGGVDGKVHLLEVTNTVTKLLELEGHKGWIRSLAFDRHKTDTGAVVTLASASQDQRIRLWRITTSPKDANATSGEVKDGFLAHGCHLTYTVSFDALLVGHEDWVTSVQWMENGSSLLSSSMDNTIIVWTKPVDGNGSWSPSLRVGEMGGNGLLSAAVLPTRDGRLDLISLGFGGQLERWEQQPAPSKLFLPAISVNGHSAKVTDLSWSPRGDYLASVSLDQTTRMLAPLTPVESESNRTQEWHEISRAQVHGYDINCACFVLGDRPTNDLFVSGADEKILRVFEAPDEVKELVRRLKLSDSDSATNTNTPDSVEQVRAVQHAYLPELSLTNKSAQTEASESSTVGLERGDGYAKLSNLASLPVGDRLSRKTLWPEQHKLYGHGNELLSVTSSHTGKLIASACKSREERYAAVRLWNTTDWSEAQQPLEGHKSSVVQLAFSPNDQFLLSVSRDRQFCLYERQGPEQKFALVEHVKMHKRIIWCCSWSPDSRMFALGSRDQSFSVWCPTGGKWSRVCEPVAFDTAVTAVAFSPYRTTESADLLAVGLETGAIRFFSVSKTREENAVICAPVGEIPWELSPSAAVLRLAWRPTRNEGGYVLAAASKDSSVRVYNLKI
ncbi:Elongator complex protein 2 [Phytophthora cactorum]|nr:Elongator complex protein 2 [Phytophthora cactorum]KAG3082114.1 Elongator complex protein 2 [Phytophthora cactorum]KAG3188850.1 Elongator complex protein 2 [Phytophthora cactorum]KAG4054926.1 Elongator complex protein 2 [Phytophthora cactorum]